MKKIYFLYFFSAFISLTSSAQVVYKDVAGIFYNRCTGCHHPNGGAPFSMMNYSETYPNASSIQHDLNIGKMPPWPPDTTYTRLLHERIITTTEKAAILSWIAGGAQKGDTTLAPGAPVYTKYHLNGKPDLILQIPTFTSNATGNDVYNCFALPTGLSQDRIIRAFEIIPGNPSIVHHVVVKIDTTGTVSSDLSGGCFTESGQLDIGGWAPGSPPTVYPGTSTLKMGMRLKAGSKIILQIHNPAGSGGEIDSTQIRLYFYPLGTTGVRNVYANTLLQNWLMSIPANAVTPFTAKYPASGTIPLTVSIFATSPHSHHLCKDMLVYAYSTAPVDTIPLIHIPNWDFAWQGLYVHPHLVKVPAGYKLYSKHIFDNTTNNPNNPNNPPKTVQAGTSTSDEMLFDSFEWMYYQAGDDTINIGNQLNGDTLLTTSVNELPFSSPSITSYVYPNPANESATLIVTNERIANCELKIFDIYGNKVSMDVTRNADAFIIRKGNLPAGVYFYSLSAGKFIGSGKIVWMPK